MPDDDYLKLIPVDVGEFVPLPGSGLARNIELADERTRRHAKPASPSDLRLIPGGREQD